ncbi:hypothetical protein [Lysinibacillus xylanilyticus]|uniref:hypothetical protein n=1 Tax=Lysinibacillus xylanilyticus TaxID=582475 RepID=UPI0036D874B3
MIETKIINGLGTPWDFQHTQRMEKHIMAEHVVCRNMDMNLVIEISGLLLKYKKIGNYLYEILLDLFDNVNRVDRIKSNIKQLVGEVHIYDFVIEMRNVIGTSDIYGTNILSALMRLANLILQGYNVGRLEGVITAEEKVVVSNAMDPLDLSLLFLVDINRRRQLIKKIKDASKLYEGDAKKFTKYLRNKDFHGVIEQAKSLTDSQVIEIANNASASMPYSYASNLFNEIDKYFNPTFDVLQTASWEREQTGDPDSSVILYFKLLVDELFPKNFLKHRKFYVREKGVRIVFDKIVNGIACLELREVHVENEFDEHYINFFYTLESGETRMFHLCMKDISTAQRPLLYEKDAEVCLMVLAWLGLLSDFQVSTEDIKKIVGKTELESSEDGCAVLARNCNKWIEHAVFSMNKNNYHYETPTQWNYDISGTSTKVGERVYKGERLIKVSRYVRRLPAGQKASAEALALAKKFYMELEDGYTLIDEFHRWQRVTK